MPQFAKIEFSPVDEPMKNVASALGKYFRLRRENRFAGLRCRHRIMPPGVLECLFPLPDLTFSSPGRWVFLSRAPIDVR